MMYAPQVPQQPTWFMAPQVAHPQQQMTLVPVGAPPATSSGSSKKKEGGAEENKSKLLWPMPAWEERYIGEGKTVWIHKETGKVEYNDPYE